MALAEVPEGEVGKRAVDEGRGLLLGKRLAIAALARFEGEAQLAGRRVAEQLVAALLHGKVHAARPFARAEGAPRQAHLARALGVQSREAARQRGLARPVAPHERHRAPRLRGELAVADDRRAAPPVARFKAPHFKEGMGGFFRA